MEDGPNGITTILLVLLFITVCIGVTMLGGYMGRLHGRGEKLRDKLFRR